ncbi:hypothetical protein PHLH6_57070 [Pseudomonas sp. Seg1]|uniref:hypothetical protein n=1 Tax=Pseudomonas sp. Seg1 TaxID=2678259 RepID=UPI001BB3F300|nr:hypothetical protein [Pseudomonas sp. Seg1]BBP73703.1 hypothetical protein PHLH6_57070 [Pseudomonas sp. Seg1]
MTVQAGEFDTTFANDGKLDWEFPEFVSITPQVVLPLPDGRLLVVANESGMSPAFVVARLTEKGQLDVGTGFGENQQGFARISTGEKLLLGRLGASLLSNGGMLITVDYTSRQPSYESGFVAIQLLPDGRLNDEFGEDGVVTFPDGSIPVTLSRAATVARARQNLSRNIKPAVQSTANSGASGIELSGGKIALVSFGFDPAAQQTKGLVMRLNPDGTFDDTFNKIGSANVELAELGPAGNNAARGVAVQPDGSLVVYGDFHDEGTFGTYAVRFTKDGMRDDKFRTTIMSSDRLPIFNDMAVRKKDGIIALIGGQRGDGFMSGEGVIVVLSADGSPHPMFNNGQPLCTKVVPETGQNWSSCAFGEVDESKLIVAGTSGGVFATDETHAVCARYRLTGELDSTFNGSGWVSFDQEEKLEISLDLHVTAQNKIVICGEYWKDRLSFATSGWIARFIA